MLALAALWTALVAGKFNITDVQRCENFARRTTPRKTALPEKKKQNNTRNNNTRHPNAYSNKINGTNDFA